MTSRMNTLIQKSQETGKIKRFKALPGQRRFMESTAPELLYSGAFGAGKSRVLCEKALFLCLRYPGNFGGIFRKTRKSLTHTTLRSFLKDVCPPEYIVKHHKQDDIITLVNGSQIIFGGLDDPDKWGSLEMGFCGIDEVIELEEDDYMMLLGRLRLTKLAGGGRLPIRQIFSATNPSTPGHWVYKRFYVDGEGEVVESSALENIHNPPDYLERLKKFKGRYRERYVEGKWVGFEGLVYDCWDPRQHIIPWRRLPKSWPRVRSIDFGYSNPFVCQWWAIGPDDTWYRYREIYMSGRLVTEHAKQIAKLSEGENIVATYADHDAEDRATLEAEGIKTQPADKEISPGIQDVYKLMMPRPSGKPRLFFMRDSLVELDSSLAENKKPTCTEEEIPGYVWAKPVGDKNPKEEPVKRDDHGLDAMRYAIHSHLNRGGGGIIGAMRRATRLRY